MRTLVIANRGEIARRILRTGRERGYRVAVVSTPADADAPVRAEADEVLSVESFLDAEGIVRLSKQARADVLHPGYGFLSENASFARLVEDAGIAFCGPTPQSMEELGNKESAKKLAIECDVPTLSAVTGDEMGLLSERGIEPPYLVKAVGGGGGRGMRVVSDPKDLPAALKRASEEAQAGFGDSRVFVERYLAKPRHIEIQVMGDGGGGGVVLGERECSLQRRFQKVIEEAPSPVVDEALREQISAAALSLVTRTRYRGAGTVEFLLDEDGSFYFLEVNTRLQVEHPVTEAVYDIDLVSCQLEIAEGRWPEALDRLERKRWAIEARVLAEDPRAQFLPTPGPLLRYREPLVEHVRVDSGVQEGGRVHQAFDSMIAKVIAIGDHRAEAVARLDRALESMVVHGTTTNLPFLQAVVRHPDFLAGRFSTSWIGEHLDELNGPLLPESVVRRVETSGFREQLSFALRGEVPGSAAGARFRAGGSRGSRVGGASERFPISVDVDRATGDAILIGMGLAEALPSEPEPSFRFSSTFIRAAGVTRQAPDRARWAGVATALDPQRIALSLFGETFALVDPRGQTHRLVPTQAADGEVKAPMAGKVLDVLVASGDSVEEGQVLAVVESMKMQLEARAPLAGIVASVLVEPGQVLEGPDVLVILTS